MNFKKILSYVAVTFMVFLLVGTVAYFATNNSEDMNLFKKEHSFRTTDKINQYPKDGKCSQRCVEEDKGYNCGRFSQACCENEASCESSWGALVCKNKKKFDCKYI